MGHSLDEVAAEPYRMDESKLKYSREDVEAVLRARERGVKWRQIAEHFNFGAKGKKPQTRAFTEFKRAAARYGISWPKK